MKTDVSWAIASLDIVTSPVVISEVTAGATVVVTLRGEMDRDNCADVRVAVGEVLYRDSPDRIDLDLSRVTFLDSAGIGALLLCRRDARLHGCELGITAVHPHVRQVLAITGLLAEFGLN